MNRSVRTGAILFAVFGAMLLLEFLWIQLGPPWFASATRWADLHPPESQPPLVMGGVAVIGLAWALLRGYRWAWLVAVLWAALCGGVGAIAVVVLLFSRTPTVFQYVGEHTVETAGGIMSLGCLLASLRSLLRREARTYFREGEGFRRDEGSVEP